jgi:SAM-dependent methyltransferase
VVTTARGERAAASGGADHYDRYVVPFTTAYTQALLDAVGDRVPVRVLDHGAGTGTITRRILDRFADIHVTALDPSQAMLQRLADQLEPSLRDRVEIRRGTVADLRDPDRFDLIVSQLAFMFVPDPEADLRAMRAHVETGARLIIGVLGGRSDVTAFDLYWSAAARLDARLAAPGDYPHFRFADPTNLIAALGRAGWTDVECRRVNAHREVTSDDLWRWLSGALPLRLRTGEPAVVAADTQRRLRVDLLAAADAYSIGPDRFRLPMDGWCLCATA